jgi:hypothetical protein
MGYFCYFQVTAQSKQPPIGQKLAQFGHPVDMPTPGNVFKENSNPAERSSYARHEHPL